jgi:alkylation response protein AidB-like acyl-CoA dehydrogenase
MEMALDISDVHLAAAVDELTKRLSGLASLHDQAGAVPPDIFADAHRAGLAALTVPARYGGRGAGLETTAAVIGRLAQGDASVALILAMQSIYHGMIACSPGWPAALHEHLGRAAADDGALLNALRAEPELGTPMRGGLPATTAQRDGDGWTVTGTKIFATGGRHLTYGLVWAKTDEPDPRVGFFVVPLESEGVSLEPSWNHLGMRATESHTYRFDRVRIPHRFAGELRHPSDSANSDPLAQWNNIVLAALYDGIARGARAWFLHYLHSRVPANLGASLAAQPRFQELTGSIDALLLSNRSVLRDFFRRERSECGRESSLESALVKCITTDNAIRVVDLAVSSIGNAGLTRNHPIERHYRDVLCSRVHVPQQDMIVRAAGIASLKAVA